MVWSNLSISLHIGGGDGGGGQAMPPSQLLWKPLGSYFSNIVKVSKNTLTELLTCEIFQTPINIIHICYVFYFYFSHCIANVAPPPLFELAPPLPEPTSGHSYGIAQMQCCNCLHSHNYAQQNSLKSGCGTHFNCESLCLQSRGKDLQLKQVPRPLFSGFWVIVWVQASVTLRLDGMVGFILDRHTVTMTCSMDI